MRYIVENLLLFDSKEGTLSAVESGKTVQLPYASVLVLKVLCDNSQQLMTRNDLMDLAWTENGLRASGSNLYNSLSIIRRRIVSLGIDLQPIRTQPKVGVIMEATVSVLEEPDDISPPSVATGPDEGAAMLIESHSLAEHAIHTQQREQESQAKRPWWYFRAADAFFYLSWTIFITALFFITRTTLTYSVDYLTLSPESHFKMGQKEGCTLFRLNEYSNIYPELSVDKKIIKLASEDDIDCHEKKANFYIDSHINTPNTYNGTSRLNVICVFNKANNKAVDCINDFYRQRGG